jgi:transcriptional regulator with GAF, ATPase, and Fis domain
LRLNPLSNAGRTKNILLTATLDDEVVSGMVIDITERKKAEEEIKKRVKELGEFYEMAVGRELRIKHLKRENEQLKQELERYQEQ